MSQKDQLRSIRTSSPLYLALAFVQFLGLVLMQSGQAISQSAEEKPKTAESKPKTTSAKTQTTGTEPEAMRTKRSATGSKAGAASQAKSTGARYAVIETDKGVIEVEFYEKDAPRAVENFCLLAQRGYYNGVTFHRLIPGFMIQGGDPKGDGTGGQSAWGGEFADEINPNSELYQRGYRRGIMAMANRGPNTNGSQFFIMHQDYGLPPRYVIFGNVAKGLEVVDAIAEVTKIRGADGNISKPITPVVMRKVTIKTQKPVAARLMTQTKSAKPASQSESKPKDRSTAK